MAGNIVPQDDDLTATLGTRLKRWAKGFINMLDVANGSRSALNTLQRSTAYAVGDVVTSSKLNAKFRLVCTTAGTTSDTEPDMTGATSGSTVTDGTAVWKVKTIVSAEDVNAIVPPSVGSATKPIYTNSDGVLTESNGNVGSAVKPIYMSNGEFTVSNGNVGSSKKLIYMDDGEFKESAENLGSKIKIIYIAGGEIKESDQNLGAEDQALYLLSGAFAAGGKFVPIQGNAGFHNSVYRGKNLGASFTAAQIAAIAAGTFDDLFIGDYWVINNITWRIAAFDYWYNHGDTACTTHHVVIVPDTSLVSAKMNSTNIATGAYVGSDYYTGNNSNTGKATAKAAIEAAFGASHILSHREYLKNAVTNGYESAGAWYDSTFELMTEQMVYGGQVFTNVMNGTNIPAGYTIDNAQLPLFRFRHDLQCISAYWWLRSVVSGTAFALVNYGGGATYLNASNSYGIRPAFAIY